MVRLRDSCLLLQQPLRCSIRVESERIINFGWPCNSLRRARIRHTAKLELVLSIHRPEEQLHTQESQLELTLLTLRLVLLFYAQSYPIFGEEATQERAENARLSSFVGALAIGDLVKSTLGPKGMNKILHSCVIITA